MSTREKSRLSEWPTRRAGRKPASYGRPTSRGWGQVVRHGHDGRVARLFSWGAAGSFEQPGRSEIIKKSGSARMLSVSDQVAAWQFPVDTLTFPYPPGQLSGDKKFLLGGGELRGHENVKINGYVFFFTDLILAETPQKPIN